MINLDKITLFKGITQDEFEEMIRLSSSRKVEYGKKEMVFEQGDKPSFLYVIIDGGVKVCNLDSAGNRSVVNIFNKPGEVFGEVYAFISTQGYDHYCITIDETSLLQLPVDVFTRECKGSKKLLHNMLGILARKAYYLNRKNIILSGVTLRQKLCRFILANLVDGNRVDIKFNREELADYIGSTRSSVSREIGNMEKDGLIESQKGRITVLDYDGIVELQ